MLLAWRFHSSRIFFALLVLFLAREATMVLCAGASSSSPWPRALQIALVMPPLDFILLAFMHERGFTKASVAPVGLLLFSESVIVAVVGAAGGGLPAHSHHVAIKAALPDYILIVFVAAGIFLLVRALYTRKLADSALLWSLAAFFLSLRFMASARVSTAYSAAAACVLAAAIIENSYLLAYHDELTTLPSRRAFNDALLRLPQPYSIAVVDIDHFKKFNDTYGHDTGDQVLRLVAAKLSRVSGGGQSYRCGGEEFAVLFPGKVIAEVVPHLEQLRAAIEASEFRMRSGDRRQIPRGPDRRNERTRRRARKGQMIRHLMRETSADGLSVTVSIGVASSTGERSHPDLVLQSADKALYRAKANGRNRVETASSVRRGAKAAGIA
jgi:diguanylate cyclase (GGDEF)-like protein